MCCPEPDDVQYDLSLYGCGQIIELNDFCVLFAVPYNANVMLRLWRPRVTECAIMSSRSQLHAVLTVPITGEACNLMVSTAAGHARVRHFRDCQICKRTVLSIQCLIHQS